MFKRVNFVKLFNISSVSYALNEIEAVHGRMIARGKVV